MLSVHAGLHTSLVYSYFYIICVCMYVVYCRACLNLVSTGPPQVQMERNLISCVSALEQLGVRILPVQLRLRTNPLDIIRDVLNSSPSVYLQHDKVMS